MTREEYMMMMMGNDADSGIFNDPAYKFRNMRTPNSVVDPKTGEYLGEYEFMPQEGLLNPQPPAQPVDAMPGSSNLDAERLRQLAGQGSVGAMVPGVRNLGINPTNQDIAALQNNLPSTPFNLGALLKSLQQYR